MKQLHHKRKVYTEKSISYDGILQEKKNEASPTIYTIYYKIYSTK